MVKLADWERGMIYPHTPAPSITSDFKRSLIEIAADHCGVAALVSVIIPCYNQARFLNEAIESVLAQTYAHVEIVVVDDGSTDNTAEVAARYLGVRYLRQNNQGLSAARNAGVRHSGGSYLVFLDADDRLLPTALEVGLTGLNAHPACAFVAGHYREISFDGSLLREPQPHGVRGDYYAALLQRNFIAMHATVMYQRILFQAAGGFDAEMHACEDYDLYLRIARRFPICCHDTLVAEYRKHGTSITRSAERMLQSVLQVHRRQWPYVRHSNKLRAAYTQGRHFWQNYYGQSLAGEVGGYVWSGEWKRALQGIVTLLRYDPSGLAGTVAGWITSTRAHRSWRAVWQARPTVGEMHFGSLRRVTPLSRVFGFDRGLPIDRYYLERFLSRHAEDIRGRVLEIGDDSYTRTFGESRVTRSDVLHAVAGNPRATIVADLTCADHIPSDCFDCIILTQTLQLIYDLHAALKTLYRILKPGGVLLATVPGISQIGQDEWRDRWCWSFTTVSARRLFEEVFPADDVTVEPYGNVLAAISFLHGLAAEELDRQELDYHDPLYELSIAIRSVKPEPHMARSRSRQLRSSAEHTALVRARRSLPRRAVQPPLRRSTTAVGPATDGCRLTSRSRRRVLILLYHRVADGCSDPWALSVTPQHFAEHLAIIRQHVRPMRLADLAQALIDNTLPDRSVVLTFDDGYADNLHNARPLLERYDVPATVFPAIGYVGCEREFWWDELERLLLQPGTLPEALRLPVDGHTYEWELGEVARYTADNARAHRAWKAWEDPPTARHMLYRSLYELLFSLPGDRRQAAMDELASWAHVCSAARPAQRALAATELDALAQGNLIELGAHTLTHPVLSALPVAAQWREIRESKARLEEILRRPVASFAYPYGRRRDYTAETIAIVRETGFTCACSNFAGSVGRGADRFQLPRVQIRDWDADEFARRLSRWFRHREAPYDSR